MQLFVYDGCDINNLVCHHFDQRAEISTDIRKDMLKELSLQSVPVSPLAWLLRGDHLRLGESLCMTIWTLVIVPQMHFDLTNP